MPKLSIDELSRNETMLGTMANKQQKELARWILKEASCREGASIFNSTGFSENDISIFHQQKRCLALAWALHCLEIVTDKSVVAVVGGGFSGIIVAGALTLMSKCVVYLFEQEDKLLALQRGSAFRYINPNVNSQDLFEHFDPAYKTPWDPFPLFQWRADYAVGVANQFLTEFDCIRRHRPIVVCQSSEVLAVTERSAKRRRKVSVEFCNRGSRQSFAADVAILATGFGKEKNPFAISDFTYWYSGYPTRYIPEKPLESVLISGLGDSGVVELLHYALNDFSHQKIVDLFPKVRGFALTLQQALNNTLHRDILFFPEHVSREGTCIPEISWYLERKYYELYDGAASDKGRKIHVTIERSLRELARGRGINFRDYESVERLCTSISASDQNGIKATLKPLISEVASREIKTILDNYIFERVFPGDLSGLANHKFRIYANGVTSTPYSDALSPLNIIVVWLLRKIGAFTYLRGEISPPVELKRAGYSGRISGRRRALFFDRFATRYGPQFDSFGSRAFTPTTWNEEGTSRGNMLATPEALSRRDKDGIAKRVSLIERAVRAGVRDIRQQEARFLNSCAPNPELHQFRDGLVQTFAQNNPTEFHRHWLRHCERHPLQSFLDFESWLIEKNAKKSNGGSSGLCPVS